MIEYKRFFDLMKSKGMNTARIREQNIIGQETLRKLKIGTGVLEEYDYVVGKEPLLDENGNPVLDKNGKPKQKSITEKRVRETSIDSKSIESLCIWLECQPDDIMEVIPNRWENEERLYDALKLKDENRNRDTLSRMLQMESE